MSARWLIKPAVFFVMAAPLLWLGVLISQEIAQPGSALGVDPGEALVHYLGEWGLRALLLAFSITPLFRLTRLTWVGASRRMIGLFAFAYVVLHVLAYLFYYLQFSGTALLEDVIERPYITAGAMAFLCLVPMAVTSTRGWRIRLRERWAVLHRLIFPATGLAVIHLWWLTKDQYGEVLLYAAWLSVLLAWRVRNARGSIFSRVRSQPDSAP